LAQCQGAVVAAGSVFSCLFPFATELFLPRSNPCMGILVYIPAPISCFPGLALIIAGARGRLLCSAIGSYQTYEHTIRSGFAIRQRKKFRRSNYLVFNNHFN
jgi:hypothetical protein